MTLLRLPPPRYGHLPLWRSAGGQRLSKREGAEGLAAYRERGMDAAAVVGELAVSLGLMPAGSRLSAGELLAELKPASLAAAIQTARMGINCGP